jgi:hypothetical protein
LNLIAITSDPVLSAAQGLTTISPVLKEKLKNAIYLTFRPLRSYPVGHISGLGLTSSPRVQTASSLRSPQKGLTNPAVVVRIPHIQNEFHSFEVPRSIRGLEIFC